MNKKFFLIICIILLIAVDLISKYFIYDMHFLNKNYFITPILNTGISWWISIFHFNILIFLIPVILGIVIYLYYKKEIWYFSFIFIFAWWLANFIDRLIYHWVRDFIDLHFFPIFNIADIFVSIWVLLILYSIYKKTSI